MQNVQSKDGIGQRGGEKKEKTITVVTDLKLTCENINRWFPGGVAPGEVGSITLVPVRVV
jgi:hypothetical protein